MQILASNIDLAYLLVTLKSPVTQIAFIDRFLVAAESFRIPTTILFNKVDLFGPKEHTLLKELTEIYSQIGYPCHPISAENQENITFLRAEIQGKQVMISGNSGVGKTTLVNALDSTLNLRTGEISQVHEQGKHTTTFAEMHALQSGGYIIDTPGIRAFGLAHLDSNRIVAAFEDLHQVTQSCMPNCSHHEVGCQLNEWAAPKGVVNNERSARVASLRSLLELKDSNPPALD